MTDVLGTFRVAISLYVTVLCVMDMLELLLVVKFPAVAMMYG